MTLTDELTKWSFEKKCEKTVEALIRNGFKAIYCSTRQEAVDYIMKEASDAKTVGFGGSLTIADLGVQAALSAQKKEILSHGLPGLSQEAKLDMMRKALTSDLFLAGVNAVTVSGSIVNIDATGNRVAAMMFGPRKVIVAAGRNKIVDGDVSDAILRVRERATPPNSKRLGFNTPCAKTGFCSDCDAPDRLCRAITILERKPRGTDFHVLVINEDTGL